MMRKRVLFMINSMRGGGSEQQTLLLLRYLNRASFEPHLYLTHRTGDLLARVPNDVIIHSYDEVRNDGGVYFPGRAMRQQTHDLGRLLDQQSIDAIYDRTFHMTMVAGPAADRRNVPRVSTIVSPPEEAIPMVETRFIGFKRRRLSRAYHQSQLVLAVSHQAAESAERYYQLPVRSIEVVPNPVDVNRVTAAAEQDNPPRDHRITLVCVGRMSEEKGHRDLINAIAIAVSTWSAETPPLRVWMIGDGPLRANLEDVSQRIPAPHQIEFLGRLANPAPYVKAADCLVLPSHFEGMPNVVLEAMALGTPVIATSAGGTTELQRKQPTMLLVKPRAPESLAEAIEQLTGGQGESQRRVEAAKSMINEDHNVERIIAQIEAKLLHACASSK